MPRTRDQLINKVLQRIGAFEAGNSPAPEDRAIVDDQIDDTLASLRGRNVIDLDIEAGIPEGAYKHLASVLADDVSDDFGLQGDDAVKIAARAKDAEQKLMMLTRSDVGRNPAQSEYF